MQNQKSTSGEIASREDITPEYKWRIEDLYSNKEDWENDFIAVKEALPVLSEYKGGLGRSAQSFYEFLKKRDRVWSLFTRAYVYSFVKRDEDTRVQENLAQHGRIANLGTELSESLSFARPEILQIPEETMSRFLEEEPALAVYGHYLDGLFRLKQFTLSASEEAILAGSANLSRGISEIFNTFTNTDIRFPSIRDEEGDEVPTSNSLYYKYRGSKDREVRRLNEEAYHGTYRNYRNSLAAMMQANVNKNRFYARTRGYENCLQAALHGDNIPLEVFHSLIRNVNEHLAPLHRYARLRKKILGVNTLRPQDLYCSLFPSQDIELSYEEARKTTEDGLLPLGDDYMQVFREGLSGGWVDVYENQGKRSGAYSTSAYGVHPFVLHNYHGTLNDVFTLAHEMGHAMHSHLTQTHQPFIYGDYPIFAAEVASTANESLLMLHLLKTRKDRSQRLYLLDFYLDRIRQTFYRQVLFSEFELEIHERAEAGETLTADLLEKIYGELFQKYYGPELDVDKYKVVEWSRIPHFYRNFYVYTYATGISAGTAFAKKILEEGDTARDGYIRHFLSGGSSDYAINLLKKAGLDMTSPEPILATTGFFDELLNELESLLEDNTGSE